MQSLFNLLPKDHDCSHLPNILIIQSDQHRGSIMRCAGDTRAITPNFDRLAAEGTRFTNCISGAPVCMTFRATMQTGLYPHTHGVVHSHIRLDPQHTGIAEVMTHYGYATGYIGKWHCDGGAPNGAGGFVPPGKRRYGWQEWHGHEQGHKYFQPFRYDRAGNKHLVEGYNWEPLRQTEMALDFARRRTQANQPWCYYISFGPPHKPNECPQEFLDMHDPRDFELASDVTEWLPPDKEPELRKILQMYYGQVSALDVEIGRLLHGLQELDIDEQTLIFYTSDHGDFLGSHFHFWELLRGKEAPLRASISIPLIIRRPGTVRSGQVLDTLVSSVDLAPTILSLAGLPVPGAMQGHSMASWCLEGHGPANKAVYLGMGEQHTNNPSRQWWRGIYTHRYTYSPGRFHVLYDRKHDPFELENLIDAPKHEALRTRLHEQLLQMAKQTCDPLLPEIRELEKCSAMTSF